MLVNRGIGKGVAREDVVPGKNLAVPFRLRYERRDRRSAYQPEARHDTGVFRGQ